MNLKLFSSIVLVTIISKCEEIHSSRTTFNPRNFSNENNCVYDEQEAQENPWTATLRISFKNNSAVEYYTCAILDEHTVLTTGKPFNLNTNKLAFLPWSSYTILINSKKNGTNLTVTQSLQVSFMQPDPSYARDINDNNWMLTENDYIIIHLKERITLSSTVRPACLPKLNGADTIRKLNSLYAENVTAIIAGWKRYKPMDKTSLTIKFRSTEECEMNWWIKTKFEKGQLPYQNRVCGYVSGQNSNNPNDECTKDSGVFVNHGGEYIFIGFVNRFFSYSDKCNEETFFFIYKLTPSTLNWLTASLRCGNSQYTCHNGECVPLNSVCNQKKDGCSDESDENSKYCRALNPCTENQFECGPYGNCVQKFTKGKEAKNCDDVSDCPLNEDEEICEKKVESIPTKKVLSAVGIGIGALLVVLMPISILIYRKLRQTIGWGLTEEIIVEFEFGCELQYVSEIENVSNKPYDSETYEIPIQKIIKGEKIGRGYFGDVYTGRLKDHSAAVLCAIKVPKSNANLEEVKEFLKEIKIMAHVGKHKNIVNFIGAYTQKLREGILYIIVEFCEFGNMRDFLIKNRHGFTNQFNPSPTQQFSIVNPGYVFVEADIFSTTDLFHWASQISGGMAHLANKQVIHGDLSAKNILFDGNYNAKICDFGLSHNLYTNINYIVSPQFRMPWKWMAVETILDRVLSTKSDVWSFGVTLWEMFTLGAEPYENVEWSPSFAYSLSCTGCQLEEPKYSNAEIFQIMRNCWAIDPMERPNFSNIETYFKDNLQVRNP